MKINTTLEEQIKIKFNDTIKIISTYVTESKNDIGHNQYTAAGVHDRMTKIKDAFEKDLQTLINSIEEEKV
jgi:hypothetical protein